MSKRFPDIVFAHWSKLIENFAASPSEFYALLVQAIVKRQIPDTTIEEVFWSEGGVLTAKRKYLRIRRSSFTYDICGAPFGTSFFVSSWLIQSPQNLVLSLGLLVGLLFAASFAWAIIYAIFNSINWPLALHIAGTIVIFLLYPLIILLTGILIRQGVLPVEEYILETPVIGWLYTLIFQPITYYRIDTMIMFHESMHSALIEALEAFTKEKGVLKLTEADRKPILKEFFRGQHASQSVGN